MFQNLIAGQAMEYLLTFHLMIVVCVCCKCCFGNESPSQMVVDGCKLQLPNISSNLLKWSDCNDLVLLGIRIHTIHILLDVLLCSIAVYFYELCRILTRP